MSRSEPSTSRPGPTDPAPVGGFTPDWPVATWVRAACTLRAGGASAPPYDSLNLASHVGAAPEAVRENRRRLRAGLALPAEPLWLEQVHGTAVLDADRFCTRAGPAPGTAQRPPRADAAVTRTAGRVLAVLIADCIPVLFARADSPAVAVAHAGWRGLAAGVLESAVAALGGTGESLHAWIGPGIGKAHFEVGEEVRCAFGADRQAAGLFSVNARGRWQCDLHGLVRARLAALGVRSVHGGPCCTYAQPERFFSYRRDGRTGRMAALIWLARA